MDRFYAFKKMLAFMEDTCTVTDACMNNYAGDIVITGISDEDGSTVTISVSLKEEENDGN